MHIQKLQLYTQSLSAQEQFYGETLNLPVKKVSDILLEIDLGDSVLIFKEKTNAKPYHFAFHISAQKENEALNWLRDRVEILKLGENEIIDFSSWNAKSLYFRDADKNIVEFISRRHLFSSKSNGFSVSDICGIAEIGLATDDVAAVFKSIQQKTTLEQYSGDLEKFCPIGDDQGLFITIDNNQKKTWFPTEDRAKRAAFSVSFSHQKRNFHLSYNGKKVQFT